MEDMLPMHHADVVGQCEIILDRMHSRISRSVEADDVWFTLRLRSFYFFLTTGKFLSSGKPDAPLYRPVIAALVGKGEMDKRFLEAVDREIEAPVGKQLADTLP
jgi:hypothetical protein